MFRIVCVQEQPTITISVTGSRRSQPAETQPVEKLQKCDAAWQAAWPVMSSWCAGVTGACHALLRVTVTMSRCVTLGPHCQHWHPPLTDIWRSHSRLDQADRAAGAGARVRPGQVLCSLHHWRLARAEDRPQPGSPGPGLSHSASPATSQPGTKQGQQPLLWWQWSQTEARRRSNLHLEYGQET